MDIDVLQLLTQFGAAGLIGLLWIVERRHASTRERQLTETHRRLLSREQTLDAMLNVVRDNTRAIVSLEHTQRQLIELAANLGVGKRG
jgi:hypothetical protein